MEQDEPQARSVGRWRLEEPLGVGAFGTTWKARGDDDVPVALKLLDRAPGEELRALASVAHPDVVQLVDAGPQPPHIVMELAPGRPLSEVIAQGPLDADRVVKLARDLSDALAAIHHAGVTHGDLKPANLIVHEDRVRVVDFGMAGQSGGTAGYAAPERLRGQGQPASDVYALGVLLVELLTGELPETPRADGVEPAWFGELLGRMLAEKPHHRPTSEELADAFEAHGLPARPPDVDLLRRRSRRLKVPRPGADAAIAAWLEEGGRLALCGPRGSGRRSLLDNTMVELQARGLACVRLRRGVRLDDLLDDTLRQTLAAEQSPSEQGWRLAQALGDRAVLVDPPSELDASLLPLVRALLARPDSRVLASRSAGFSADGVRTIDLRPLTDAQLDRLAHGVLGTGARIAQTIPAIRAWSAGWPQGAIEWILTAVETGAPVRRGQRWRITTRSIGQVSDHIVSPEERLDALSPSARDLGALVALHGTPMSHDVGRRRLGEAFDAALGELLASGAVTARGRRLDCSSRAIARALAATPGDLHAFLLDPSVQAWTGHTPDRLLRFALAGGLAGEVARYAVPGVRHALQWDPDRAMPLAVEAWSHAPSPALAVLVTRSLADGGEPGQAESFARDHLDQPGVALELAHILADQAGRDDEVLELLDTDDPRGVLLRARVHHRGGRPDQAIALATQAASLPAPEDEDALDTWLALRALWAEAVGLPAVGGRSDADPDAGLHILAQVPDEVGAGRAERARLEGVRARLLRAARRPREAIHVAEAATRVDAGLPALSRARLCSNLAVFRYEVGDRQGALGAWEDARDLFLQLDSPTDAVYSTINLSVAYREFARWDRALQRGREAVRLARQLAQPALEAVALGNLGDTHLARGEHETASHLFQRAERIAIRHELTGELQELARRRADLAVRALRPDATARTLHALEVTQDNASEHARVTALLAICAARRRERERVERLLETALGTLRDAGDDTNLAYARVTAAEAWLELEDHDQARRNAQRAAFYADEVQNRLLRIRADEILGRCEVDAGSSMPGLHRLLALSVLVESGHDLQAMLDAIASSALDLLQADRSFVLLGEGDDQVVRASATRYDGEPGAPSRSIVRRAVTRGGREVIVSDMGERGELRAAESVSAFELEAAMAVPLVASGRVLGVLYVDQRQASERELSESAWLMRALASTAASALTNAKRLEDSTNQVQEAREFVHDVRSILTGVHLTALVLQDELGLEGEGSELLDQLLASSQRMERMVARFLEGVAPSPERLDLGVLTGEMVTAVRFHALDADVHLDVEPADILVDALREDLGRALMNLMTNAIKYTPRGGVVTIRMRAERGRALWTIRDQGPGVPQTAMDRIFERGVQAPDAQPGQGLGLAIVRRVAEAHGGRVHARNVRGGALFELDLPLASPRRSGNKP